MPEVEETQFAPVSDEPRREVMEDMVEDGHRRYEHEHGYQLAEAEPGMDIDLVDYCPETYLMELFSIMTKDARREIVEHENEIFQVMRHLGGDGPKYKRERQRAVRAVVSEIYSPPRVTAAIKLLPELRVIPGFALDLTTVDADGRAWNFDEKEMRDKGWRSWLINSTNMLNTRGGRG